jgi:predicted alpha-1,2-mannosidase
MWFAARDARGCSLGGETAWLLASLVIWHLLFARVRFTPVDYVNTLRGSHSNAEFSRGNTFPAVTLPFGFNFWTPITEGNSENWLYRYDRTTLQGFGVSHQPSPWVRDHGSIQLMPEVGPLRVSPTDRAATFQHAHEVARPHYYSVVLESSSIRVEFTPTDHASRFRFTYPPTESAHLLFDSIDSVKGEIRVDPAARTIEGHVDQNGPRLYFFARIEVPITGVEYPVNAGVCAAIHFDTRKHTKVELSMATSFIDIAQARANLDAEIGPRRFDDVRAAAGEIWNDKLGLIEVEGATRRQKVTLYSNLYRALMYPNSMWEKRGREPVYFSPYDDAQHTGKIWVNNGFWDTYRAAWPLYVLLLPEEAGTMLDGFVRAYLDGGWTPRWSGPGYLNLMLGTHLDSVFSDAYLKGVRNFDVAKAHESMLKNALVASKRLDVGRHGNEASIFRGYVATNIRESAAWSLENTVNDYGIAQLSAALGDSLHARYFHSRALAYKALFSAEKGFFRGRNPDGTWRSKDPDFEPREWGSEFAEGNPWHYAFAANHDPEGMARLYGGRAALSNKIDGLFEASREFVVGSYNGVIHEMTEAYATNMGQYAHANEPTHHILYMYNYAGTPWKTQERVRAVMDEARGLYGPGLEDGDGYIGDEDNGQMSAWFIFSALGFYPASPGHPEYAIGSPLYPRATIHLPHRKTFVVSAPENNDKNRYIQSAKLNGQLFTRNYLTHAQIIAGGELELEMGPSPSNWGSGDTDVPSSLTKPASEPQPLLDLARDGTLSASDARPDHTGGFAVDDDSDTEWFASAGASIEYQLPTDQPQTVTMYTLTSGRGDESFDPSAWTLSASEDGTTWTPIDSRLEQTFPWRQQTRVYAVKHPMRAAHYRLTFDATGSETHLAELELLARDPGGDDELETDFSPATQIPDSGAAEGWGCGVKNFGR